MTFCVCISRPKVTLLTVFPPRQRQPLRPLSHSRGAGLPASQPAGRGALSGDGRPGSGVPAQGGSSRGDHSQQQHPGDLRPNQGLRPAEAH